MTSGHYGLLRAARLGSQGLAEPSATRPIEVVERILAVQAQDPRGARLAVRARSVGLCAADIDRALSDDRSLVVGWLNRGTLHLVAAKDYWWLHSLTAPGLATSNERRLRQEQVSPRRADLGVDVVGEAVATEGPLTRHELGSRLRGSGVPTAGQALVHVLFLASIRGRLVRGPVIDGEQCFVDPISWISEPDDVTRDEALERLARRYLAGHGPADARDLSRWSGLALGETRTALAAIGEETEPFGEDGQRMLAGVSPRSATPALRLLGSFDPILHGWASREPFVGSHDGVVTTNGIFRPTLLVDGRVVATWRFQRDDIEVKPFARLGRSIREAVVDEARDVVRFLGRDAQTSTTRFTL